MFNRSSAMSTRPSSPVSAATRSRHFTVMSGKYGSIERATPTMDSRRLCFSGRTAGVDTCCTLIRPEVFVAKDLVAGRRYYLVTRCRRTIKVFYARFCSKVYDAVTFSLSPSHGGIVRPLVTGRACDCDQPADARRTEPARPSDTIESFHA